MGEKLRRLSASVFFPNDRHKPNVPRFEKGQWYAKFQIKGSSLAAYRVQSIVGAKGPQALFFLGGSLSSTLNSVNR